MKQLGETLRDELVRQTWVSIVELQTARPYEVSIEVSEDSLQRYQISFDQPANGRQASINLPAGSVKRDSGDLLIQTVRPTIVPTLNRLSCAVISRARSCCL